MTAAKVQAMPSPIVPSEGVTVRYLPLTALHLAPWNARKSFDKQAQAELVGSIRAFGILVALIVRPLDGASKGFEIVAGHRRFLAAGALRLDELPCDVRSLTDEQAREVGLVDNLQRADLSAIEEAEAYQQMFQLAGDAGRKLTPADVAAKVGKPEGHVRLRSPDNAARRSKARLEKECRVRIFKAALEKSVAAKTSDAEIRALAVWAVDRADSNGSVALMDMLGWPKELVRFGNRAKLAAQIAKVPAGRAVAIALLASVACDLSVSEYSSGKPDALHDVASRYGVQVQLIRKEVAAEFAKRKSSKKLKAAAKQPSPAKKPAISKAARKKIAAAQKRRLAKVRK